MKQSPIEFIFLSIIILAIVIILVFILLRSGTPTPNFCTQNSDCSSGQYCGSTGGGSTGGGGGGGVCVVGNPPPDGSRCFLNSDCVVGSSCVNGACVASNPITLQERIIVSCKSSERPIDNLGTPIHLDSFEGKSLRVTNSNLYLEIGPQSSHLVGPNSGGMPNRRYRYDSFSHRLWILPSENNSDERPVRINRNGQLNTGISSSYIQLVNIPDHDSIDPTTVFIIDRCGNILNIIPSETNLNSYHSMVRSAPLVFIGSKYDNTSLMGEPIGFNLV